MSELKVVTDESFEQDVLKSQGNVVVDFSATWCPPCRKLAPVLEELAQELAGKVTILKMDVDESANTPGRFGVASVPTLVFFKDGVEIGRHSGYAPKPVLLEKLEEVFGKQ